MNSPIPSSPLTVPLSINPHERILEGTRDLLMGRWNPCVPVSTQPHKSLTFRARRYSHETDLNAFDSNTCECG